MIKEIDPLSICSWKFNVVQVWTSPNITYAMRKMGGLIKLYIRTLEGNQENNEIPPTK